MDSLLTIDIGNSSTKIGLFQDSELKWVKPFSNTSVYDGQIIISKVADRQEFKGSSIGDLRTADSFLDMPVHYTKTLGEDRLACAYYAYKNYEECLIVDAGTFLTIDLVDQNGFHGGHIIPGKELYFDCYQKGFQLKQFQIPIKPINGSPHSTEEAMGSSYSALIDALLLSHQKKILLTGGNAEWLKTQLSPQLDIEISHALIHYALWTIQQKAQSAIFS